MFVGSVFCYLKRSNQTLQGTYNGLISKLNKKLHNTSSSLATIHFLPEHKNIHKY